MKGAIVCFFVAVGLAHGGLIPATTYVRTPAHDSAIIKSDRLGGNFAYSTVEGHAYAAVSPVVQRVAEPVGVTYNAHQVNLGYAAAPVAHYASAPVAHYAAAPVAHYAAAPVAHYAAAPVAHYAAAPVAHYATAPVAQYASYPAPAHQYYQYNQYNPSVVAAASYPHYFGAQQVVAASPVFGAQQVVGASPVFGAQQVVGAGPVFGAQYPLAPVEAAAPAAPTAPAPVQEQQPEAPASDSSSDDDTVSVESA